MDKIREINARSLTSKKAFTILKNMLIKRFNRNFLFLRSVINSFLVDASQGRNGLGSIFIWATGNGGLTDDDCNCDGYTTSIYTISIGCIGDHGLSAYYTEKCSSTLAVTFNGASHKEGKENKMVRLTHKRQVDNEDI